MVFYKKKRLNQIIIAVPSSERVFLLGKGGDKGRVGGRTGT